MKDTERGRDIGRGEGGSTQDPDVGLDPGTPGSCPGLKAGTKPLSHPGVPLLYFLKFSHLTTCLLSVVGDDSSSVLLSTRFLVHTGHCAKNVLFQVILKTIEW